MSQRPNILIIDPNTQDLQLLEISLRNMGFAVTTATNTFDALKKVEIFPPDLIISETHLQDFDGFTLCRTIKENQAWTAIPFIFLSSDKNLQSKVKGLQLGVDDYLTKPIFLVELVARIRMLMQKKERESIERHESRTRFTGSIAEIGLVDIIQTIDLSKKKGVVHLARNGETGAIYFEDGNVIDAELAQLEGDEAIYRMMRWTDGFFDIEFRPIRREQKVKLGSQQILMEGLKRLDEWNRILEQLPPMETVFNVDVLELIDRLDEIPDEVNGLVALFDGNQSLKEVITNDIFSDLDTLRIVSKLIFFGVLVEHEQKKREVKEKLVSEDVVVGGEEKPRPRKSAGPVRVPSVPPEDLQFGKAEEVDVVQTSPAPVVKEPIARIAVKKVPASSLQASPTLEEEITINAEFVKGREVEEGRRPVAKPVESAREGDEAKKEETLKIKAAQVVQVPAQEAKKAAEAIVEKPAGAGKPEAEDAKTKAALDRDAKTARMYGESAKEEKPEVKVVSDKKTARWTFPRVEGESEKEEAAAEAGIVEEEAPSKVEKGEKEEAPRKEPVPSISLKEVKEEIERREEKVEEPGKEAETKPEKREKPEKKEKAEEKKAELSESGVYQKEEKDFFRSAPAGDEPVDTFEDLDFGKDKKEKSTKGLTYAIWAIIIIGIAVVLILAYGKDYFKRGPDLSLLEKLEEKETVATEPLRDKPLSEVSPMEKGETAEKAAPGEEGKGEPEEGQETQEPGKEPEGEEGQESGEETGPAEAEETAPAVAPAPSGLYAALLAEADQLMKGKNKKGALDKYKEAVEVNPNGQEALSALIDNYKENPKHPQTLEWGKRATELGPSDAKAWFGYGLALFTLGKVAEAKPVFEHCVAITPADVYVNKCRKMMKWVK